MTRQDYAKIAAILHRERATGGETQTVINITRALADMMAGDNPNFKREVFYTAAGMGQPETHDEWAARMRRSL